MVVAQVEQLLLVQVVEIHLLLLRLKVTTVVVMHQDQVEEVTVVVELVV